MWRPKATIKKVQFASDVIDDDYDSEDSTDELIGDDIVGDGDQINSSLQQAKSKKIDQKLVVQKVSKYYGSRSAVHQISFDMNQ